jgi:hypothetical protein
MESPSIYFLQCLASFPQRCIEKFNHLLVLGYSSLIRCLNKTQFIFPFYRWWVFEWFVFVILRGWCCCAVIVHTVLAGVHVGMTGKGPDVCALILSAVYLLRTEKAHGHCYSEWGPFILVGSSSPTPTMRAGCQQLKPLFILLSFNCITLQPQGPVFEKICTMVKNFQSHQKDLPPGST